MPTSHPFVDEPASAEVVTRSRVIDDWTAGDEPDFVVRPRRRRISGVEHVPGPSDHGAEARRRTRPPGGEDHDGPEVVPADAPRRTIVLEGDVEGHRRVDSWIDDDLDDMLARPSDPPRAATVTERDLALVDADPADEGDVDDADVADADLDPFTSGALDEDVLDDLVAEDDRLERDAVATEPRRDARTPRDARAGTRSAGGRRTVAISGRPDVLAQAPRLREIERRRPARTPSERVGSRPDRIALWAVGLGFALILIAALTAG